MLMFLDQLSQALLSLEFTDTSHTLHFYALLTVDFWITILTYGLLFNSFGLLSLMTKPPNALLIYTSGTYSCGDIFRVAGFCSEISKKCGTHCQNCPTICYF